jgi:MFS family permease
MWIIVALGVPFQFALQSAPNVMIAGIMQSLQINQARVGFLTSAFFYTYLIFQIPAGLLIDRYGVRRILSASVLLATMSCIGLAFSPNFASATASRLVMGLVCAPCVPAIMSFSAERFSPARFVLLAGLAESIGMLGGALGEAILGHWVMYLGWRMTWLATAALGLMIAALMLFLVDDADKKKRITCGANASDTMPLFQALACLMNQPQVWLVVIYGGLIFAVLPALAGLWIVPILEDLYGLPTNMAALGSASIFFGTALGLPVWGAWSESMGKRKPVLWIATSLALGLMAILAFGPKLNWVLLYILLIGIGFVSAVYVLAFALVREQTPRCVRASAMGLTNMMSMVIGAPLLQPVLGWILDIQSQYPSLAQHQDRLVLRVMFVVLVLAWLFVFFIRETLNQREK